MRNPLPSRLAIALMSLLPAFPALAGAGECVARSPEHTVALLELFTSEGCSSCPPADRWLGGLRAADGVVGKVVPLALHVDYWDYIGWKDPYAQPGFAARQRDQAKQAGGSAVYTPQFFIQGKPYRPPASATAFSRELEAIARQPPRADIALALAPATGGKLTARVTARLREGLANGQAGLFVALFENGLSTQVRAGENRGATLSHDFVVRQWIGPKALPATGGSYETLTFALAPDWQVGNLGLAVFVQNLTSREVLQALSRPLCG